MGQNGPVIFTKTKNIKIPPFQRTCKTPPPHTHKKKLTVTYVCQKNIGNPIKHN